MRVSRHGRSAELLNPGIDKLVDLAEFRDPGTAVLDVDTATTRIVALAPAMEPEQYLPVLVAGEGAEYELLTQVLGTPAWLFFLDGGERAYQQALREQRAVAANRHTKLRKCGAR